MEPPEAAVVVLPEEPPVFAVPVAAGAVVEDARLTNGVKPEMDEAPLKAGLSPATKSVLLGLITLQVNCQYWSIRRFD